MNRTAKYMLAILGVLFLSLPASAELCQPDTKHCCPRSSEQILDLACFVNCENPPGADKLHPSDTGNSDLPALRVRSISQRVYAVHEPTFPTSQERSVQTKLRFLTETRPNPPPFTA